MPGKPEFPESSELNMSSSENSLYKIDKYLVDVEKKKLFYNGNMIEIGGKAFEVLLVLIERRNAAVSREELMQVLWPHTPVEDSNLDKNISKLREAFSDNGLHLHRHIKTFPRFGYQFVAQVEELKGSKDQSINQLDIQTVPKVVKGIQEGKVTKDPPKPNKILIYSLVFSLLLLVGISAIFFISTITPRPEIRSITPANPPSMIGDQPIIVHGKYFQRDLTVEILFPNQGSGVLSGTQINDVTPESFVMLTDFNGNVGNYVIQVINPYGRRSNLYKLELSAYNQAPVIETVLPESPEANKKLQDIFVYGCNFQNGIIVEMTFPDGKSKILQGNAIHDQTHTAFRMQVYFDGKPGEYKIQAKHTGNNKQSNLFSFFIRGS